MSVTSIVTTYSVTGMTCGHCAAAVSEEISQLPVVSSVDIEVATGRVSVTSTGEIDDAAVGAAVAEAGYTLAGRV
ncbi:Copper chaperone CopZ [Parafrankia irregularis]|uniref:Copper chaperone CopZ n=1 Tax=Parafrankia irregularis TaxID=795642 RepID=A0A0S4QFD2_9ACTN|nr:MULTISPECIES: heavy-metal-associated domain-containing protein [Parafrankia]MBE3203137.1 heavy-metal-associated domain-containing protein [Parafrankia sp. CH37]CUU54224.1 Copper chaperone CopZ [Parafrankia irregularis]